MRTHNVQGMRYRLPMMCAGLALLMTTALQPLWAQQRSGAMTRAAKKTETASQSSPPTEAARLRTQLKEASDEYKSNLERLLALYEADAKRAEDRLPKIKEMLAQGVLTRRDAESAEDAAVQMRQKADDARAQLKSGDMLTAEAFVESDTEESPRMVNRSAPPRAINSLVQTTAYIRYGGARAWSLSQADVIKQFFIQRFGRALPIGAFGQSALHDRWGYDHRNAMDVGVSPDSTEGQILMNYLRANGIPFTAFHFAVSGKATGPHIHVGLPSHRTGTTWVAENGGNLSRH